MGKLLESINEEARKFIEHQHMYFVATAPLSAEGHVNMSPKALDTFRVINEHQVMYLDLTGSGNETSAHLMENGRITFMFCAFDGYPNILRLYGTGRVVLPSDAEWGEWIGHFTQTFRSARQIVIAEIDRISTSCGYAVPLYDFVAERDQLLRWADARTDEQIECYREEKNVRSIDGLPTHVGEALENQEMKTAGD